MHAIAQPSASWQVDVPHVQSVAQLSHVSPASGSHMALPQLMQVQSAVHVEQFSPSSQAALPHTAHVPQSAAHVSQVSMMAASQVPSPQAVHCPQSAAHTLQSSFTAQVPSPHGGQPPQSTAQFVQFSPVAIAHTPSLHPGPHGPQSSRHVAQFSISSCAHTPSPHGLPLSVPGPGPPSVPPPEWPPHPAAPPAPIAATTIAPAKAHQLHGLRLLVMSPPSRAVR